MNKQYVVLYGVAMDNSVRVQLGTLEEIKEEMEKYKEISYFIMALPAEGVFTSLEDIDIVLQSQKKGQE